MTIEEIKQILYKQATIFKTVGIKPTNSIGESFIGSVRWQMENEDTPKDSSGSNMSPLATIFLQNLPFLPTALEGIKLITVFVSFEDVYNNLEVDNLSPYFSIRTYSSLDGLIPCHLKAQKLKPFPLKHKSISNDLPMWDGNGIPQKIKDIILEMEEKEGIDYYSDICPNLYPKHKVGGYGTFCQSGYDQGNGYEFVMQIVSDEKANLNILDRGSFYFYYNKIKKDWIVYCSFS